MSLEKDGSISIHKRNFQVLATEMYKINNGLTTPFMKDVCGALGDLVPFSQFRKSKINTPPWVFFHIFPINRNSSILRQNPQFSRLRIDTVRFLYAVRHNDAHGWGGYCYWRFGNEKSYRISKLCPATAQHNSNR